MSCHPKRTVQQMGLSDILIGGNPWQPLLAETGQALSPEAKRKRSSHRTRWRGVDYCDLSAYFTKQGIFP